MKRQPKAPEFHPSSGSVFADLRVPRARQETVKTELVRALCSLVSGKELRQVDLAQRLGISQPKVSLLLSGRTDGFSTELLIRLLNRLGQHIEIVVRPAPRGRMVGDTHVDYRTAMLVEHRAKAYRATPTRAKRPAAAPKEN